MECEHCGGLVTWRGPLTALTHTECEGCGGINCQVVEQELADDAPDPDRIRPYCGEDSCDCDML